MFEVGDRVVCVDDSPVQFLNGLTGAWSFYPTPLTKGIVYTIIAVFPKGSKFSINIPGAGPITTRRSDHVAVGVKSWQGVDTHTASRFRKLRDISQSLAELKALTINCPPLVSA